MDQIVPRKESTYDLGKLGDRKQLPTAGGKWKGKKNGRCRCFEGLELRSFVVFDVFLIWCFFWWKTQCQAFGIEKSAVLSLDQWIFCVYLCLSLVDHELPANCCTTTLPLERVPKPVGGTKDEAAKPFGVYKGGNKKRWCFPILIPDFHGLGIQFIYLNPICFLTFFMFGGCHQYRAVSKSFDQVHPGRLTWNLRITHFERKMIWTKPPWLCSSR